LCYKELIIEINFYLGEDPHLTRAVPQLLPNVAVLSKTYICNTHQSQSYQVLTIQKELLESRLQSLLELNHLRGYLCAHNKSL
jgi:hypothetical protein